MYAGLPLIPNLAATPAIFAYERLSFERVEVEAHDSMPYHEPHTCKSLTTRRTCVGAHLMKKTVPTTAKSSGALPPTLDHFSVGALTHIVPKHLDLKLDLSTATRFPNVDELYILGYQPLRYASGYPSLETETVWNGSMTAGLRLETVEVELSGYGQFVDDYIYFSPELNTQGLPRFDVTIRGTYPSYEFRPIDAVFYGSDGTLNLGPRLPMGLTAQGGFVRASDQETGQSSWAPLRTTCC